MDWPHFLFLHCFYVCEWTNLCFYVCQPDCLNRRIKYFWIELNWKRPNVRFRHEKATKNIFRHHWQEDVYLQNLQLLLVIQNAAYWLLILVVKCWFWRHPKVVTIFQTWQCQKLSLHLVYSCLSWGNHLNRFYFDKQKLRRNIKTFNLLSEQTAEGRGSRLCRHTLPQAEPFIYQTLTHQGVCCYFRPPIMFFFFP